jgi:penicillin-binding protein-related factor A (putative recombinase)
MDLGHCDTRPYPDELLYSYQARIRLHFAIKSPKALLEGLYDNRSVSASWIYPSHLQRLVDVIPTTENLCATQLIYCHTLFPLAAPFMPTKRRRKIETLMLSDNDSGSHVMSGYAANKLPMLQYLRYCPICAKEQRLHCGEKYWVRGHQVPVLQFCYKHSVKLLSCTEIVKGVHRHEFVPASICNLNTREEVGLCEYDKVISVACEKLLNHAEALPSPSFAQWTNYYRQLARFHGFSKGAYVDFEPIKNRVKDYWPSATLSRCNLSITNKQTCWLHSIFRKHRKSFSYLEHIVVNAAFLREKFDIIECVKCAAGQPKSLRKHDSVSSIITLPTSILNTDQSTWLNLLQTQSSKNARTSKQALYTRLYRADSKWLVKANTAHKVKRKLPSCRANWKQRDSVTVKSLFRIIYITENDLSLPRASKRWMMYQLTNTSTVEHFAQKLPLTSMFLNRYAESVSEYQIRRLTNALVTSKHSYITRRWFLLRASGLSEERITPETKQFLVTLGDSLPSFGFFNPK